MVQKDRRDDEIYDVFKEKEDVLKHIEPVYKNLTKKQCLDLMQKQII